VQVFATPDEDSRVHGRSCSRCKFVIPISRKLPLSNAVEAQAAAKEGGTGKVLLVA
jgi:hypothetical protein